VKIFSQPEMNLKWLMGLVDKSINYRDDVVEGIFKPTWCGQTGECALALATFDSSTELNNTTKIVEHIKMEHFYVCVLFVGSNLNAALDFLQTRKGEHFGSPLIIHYHPSYATVHHNLSQVCTYHRHT